MDGNGDIIHRNGGGDKDTAEKHSNGKLSSPKITRLRKHEEQVTDPMR